jgi:hypothetical protein
VDEEYLLWMIERGIIPGATVHDGCVRVPQDAEIPKRYSRREFLKKVVQGSGELPQHK